MKDESLEHAFSRLSWAELGLKWSLKRAHFVGPFEHFYQDNFSGTSFSIHYVVLGYTLAVDHELDQLPDDQHYKYQWFEKSELIKPDRVHSHTKAYFL